MSEGQGSAGAPAARNVVRGPEAFRVGIILIVVALAGPFIGLFFGKGISDGILHGSYSLPLAVFGVIALMLHIRSPRDYYGGVALIAVALFALWAGNDLPGMRGFAFGPGTAPRLFAYCLLGLGVAIVLAGLLTDGPPMEDFTFSGTFGGAVLVVALIPIYYFATQIGKLIPNVSHDVVVAGAGTLVVVALAFLLTNVAPRGPLFITAATIIFAIAVRPLGLIIASYVSLVISANATRDVRWVEALVWCAVLTAFCSVLFPYGLNLPLQLWPRF